MEFLEKTTPNNAEDALIFALKKQISELEKQANEYQRKIEQQATQIKLDQVKIDKLVFQLARKNHLLFASRNEAMDEFQRNLFEEDCQADIASLEEEIVKLKGEEPPSKIKKDTPRRQSLPEHLPRVVVTHEPNHCTCEDCGNHLIKIGEDVSEKLDIKPAEFFVIKNIYPKYTCRSCETIKSAEIPPAVIDSGIASSGLIAWLITSKYVDHLPLYRIQQIAARQGVNLPISCTSEWIGKSGVLLQILQQRLIDKLHKREILHADETPVRQLDPGKGKTKRAYLWVYRTNVHDPDPPIIVFDYQLSRSGKHAVEFLDQWSGTLMVDDYAGYKVLFQLGATELACWAHVRRKFYELQLHESVVATMALQFIAQLYHIESECHAVSITDRKQIREIQSKPRLEKFKHWLDEIRPKVPNGSSTANALDYTLRRWPALTRYAETGDLPIDNNPVENAIRPIAVGRKNWLFTGSQQAGERAAAIQSLLATAKANGIDPHQWLVDTLNKLPSIKTDTIDTLLPLRSS